MKIGCVIAVHGREELLKYSLAKLKRSTIPIQAVIVGDCADRKVYKDNGVYFISHENSPLAKKWMHGIKFMRDNFDIDYLLVLGSASWVTDNYCEYMLGKYPGIDFMGKGNIYFVDVWFNGSVRLCKWNGYDEEDRKEEPMGAGRMISKRALDILNWKIFDETIDSSLDYNCYRKYATLDKDYHKITFAREMGDEADVLAISCYKWVNKHLFDREIRASQTKILTEYSILDKFPDIHKFIEDVKIK